MCPRLNACSRFSSLDEQLQGFAASLTRLELLPTTTWAWELFDGMPRLRSLSTGCGWELAEHRRIDLTELRLAFQLDVEMDLSALTHLRVRLPAILKDVQGPSGRCIFLYGQELKSLSSNSSIQTTFTQSLQPMPCAMATAVESCELYCIWWQQIHMR